MKNFGKDHKMIKQQSREGAKPYPFNFDRPVRSTLGNVKLVFHSWWDTKPPSHGLLTRFREGT